MTNDENPSATAIATGAIDIVEGTCPSAEFTAGCPFCATHKEEQGSKKHAPPFMQSQHRQTVRMLGCVLTLGTQDAWWGLATVLRARLTEEECAVLAFMALKALAHETAVRTTEAALGTAAEHPQAPLLSFMDQAIFWVDTAEIEEVEAYCFACFNAMPLGRQMAFLDYVLGRKAAQ